MATLIFFLGEKLLQGVKVWWPHIKEKTLRVLKGTNPTIRRKESLGWRFLEHKLGVQVCRTITLILGRKLITEAMDINPLEYTRTVFNVWNSTKANVP